MTTAVMNLYRVQKNIKVKINSIDVPKVNWKAVCFAGFFIAAVLLIFYVWQINSLTRSSYLISSYEKQIDKLLDENKNLQISFAESSFLGQALAKIQALNFQKVVSVKYIQVSDSSAKISLADKSI